MSEGGVIMTASTTATSQTAVVADWVYYPRKKDGDVPITLVCRDDPSHMIETTMQGLIDGYIAARMKGLI